MLSREIKENNSTEVFKANIKKQEIFLALALCIDKYQRRIQNPVKHERWSFLRK